MTAGTPALHKIQRKRGGDKNGNTSWNASRLLPAYRVSAGENPYIFLNAKEKCE